MLICWVYIFVYCFFQDVSSRVNFKILFLLSCYRVVEQEAQRSQQVSQDRKSPNRTNGCNENRPIDILEMLSKAKDEYERVSKYSFFFFFFSKPYKQIVTLLLLLNKGLGHHMESTEIACPVIFGRW